MTVYLTNHWSPGVGCEIFLVVNDFFLILPYVYILIGMVVIFVVYTILVIIARRHQRAIATMCPTESGNQTRTVGDSLKGIKMLSIIIIIYTLSYIPCVVVNFMISITKDTDPARWSCWHAASGIPIIWNSGINPYLYALRSHDFKDAFRQMFGRRQRQAGEQTTGTS